MAPPSPKSRCGRKRKVAENSRGLPEPARKRGRAPAAIEVGPTSSHVGVGPSFSGAHVTVPATTISLPLSTSHCSSLLPEPSSLLHAPAISASLQLPATSYGLSKVIDAQSSLRLMQRTFIISVKLQRLEINLLCYLHQAMTQTCPKSRTANG